MKLTGIVCGEDKCGHRLSTSSGKSQKKNRSCLIRKHTRFAHFPAHTHNYVDYMCEGQTHHVINGQEVYLKAGELLFDGDCRRTAGS